MKEIFSPKIVNWLLALVFGIVIPVAGQTFIADMVSGLNSAPSYINEEIVETGSSLPAILGLSALFFTYILVFAYQIWFIVQLKTHASVWALTLTITAPFLISVSAPLIFGSF